ncbi:hypothetical protein H696_01197 [Fonticula alba]|uniref:FYVE-type domain-containing protein n=1 Tax=Fonticula alba TaxID=691883 RepID=A0A058ZBK2_FONAL|nr:hypothetical protein H696_01197 [Fonticula alba]KCV71779.1 hypothetical protein H696_01197 [Fonticula alba]|eukprot:XP_009493357.1 hypothetical protein H696_01197 [Fonticula alba]
MSLPSHLSGSPYGDQGQGHGAGPVVPHPAAPHLPQSRYHANQAPALAPAPQYLPQYPGLGGTAPPSPMMVNAPALGAGASPTGSAAAFSSPFMPDGMVGSPGPNSAGSGSATGSTSSLGRSAGSTSGRGTLTEDLAALGLGYGAGGGQPTDSPTREHWVPDQEALVCGDGRVIGGCGRTFGLLRDRRHHCRRCGGVYCSSCARFRIVLDAQATFVAVDRRLIGSRSVPTVRSCQPCYLDFYRYIDAAEMLAAQAGDAQFLTKSASSLLYSDPDLVSQSSESSSFDASSGAFPSQLPGAGAGAGRSLSTSSAASAEAAIATAGQLAPVPLPPMSQHSEAAAGGAPSPAPTPTGSPVPFVSTDPTGEQRFCLSSNPCSPDWPCKAHRADYPCTAENPCSFSFPCAISPKCSGADPRGFRPRRSTTDVLRSLESSEAWSTF